MKIILTESQVKNIIKQTVINEGGAVKLVLPAIKYIGRGINKLMGKFTKIHPPKPVILTAKNISKNIIKQNLLKQGIKILGKHQLPKKFFHGTSTKIDLSTLTTSGIDKSVRKGWSTGSTDVNGIYFTENLWDNMSHYNQYTNPVYKTNFNPGSIAAGESAEKYAQLAIRDGKKGFIYEMTLSPDAVVVAENSLKGVNSARITPDIEEKLLSMGIDAIYRQGQELVVLNKSAIKSFDLKFVGDKYIGDKVKNQWGKLIPSKGSFGFNWKPM